MKLLLVVFVSSCILKIILRKNMAFPHRDVCWKMFAVKSVIYNRLRTSPASVVWQCKLVSG